MSDTTAVRIEPWGKGDLPLLEKLHGDPAMMQHLGGPESPEKLAERQQRYETAESGIFKVVDARTGEPLGLVLYWERTWREEEIYEVGWFVLPSFQGRGIASAATAQAIVKARDEGTHRFMHAFPAVDNLASNAMCREIGFALLEECDVEFPPGNFLRCNDWQLDLFRHAGDRR